MTTKENIIIKYKHTILFYVLATIIPWAFWFAAGYVSHHTVYSESKWAGAHLGNNRFVFSDASDHCISLPLS